MKRFCIAVGIVLLLAVLACPGQTKKKVKSKGAANHDPEVPMEIVNFRGAEGVLSGYFYKPEGKGPFPAVVFLSDFKKPLLQHGPASQFDQLAKFWTSNGYILFIPDHPAPNPAVAALVDQNNDEAAADKAYMDTLEDMHKDVVAAVDWLKAQASVDDSQVVLMGTMLGGTQTIVATDKGLKVSALIPFSPGAISWNKHPMLQAALRRGIRNSKVPIFLIQTQNDRSLQPSAILGTELKNKGKPNRTQVYPPFGVSNNDARNFAVNGAEVWGMDVLDFLKQVLPLLVNANGK